MAASCIRPPGATLWVLRAVAKRLERGFPQRCAPTGYSLSVHHTMCLVRVVRRGDCRRDQALNMLACAITAAISLVPSNLTSVRTCPRRAKRRSRWRSAWRPSRHRHGGVPGSSSPITSISPTRRARAVLRGERGRCVARRLSGRFSRHASLLLIEGSSGRSRRLSTCSCTLIPGSSSLSAARRPPSGRARRWRRWLRVGSFPSGRLIVSPFWGAPLSGGVSALVPAPLSQWWSSIVIPTIISTDPPHGRQQPPYRLFDYVSRAWRMPKADPACSGHQMERLQEHQRHLWPP